MHQFEISNDEQFLVWSTGVLVFLWDIPQNLRIKRLQPFTHSCYLGIVKFSPDDHFVAISKGLHPCDIFVFEVQGKNPYPQYRLPQNSCTSLIYFLKDPQYLLSIENTGILRLWQIEKGQKVFFQKVSPYVDIADYDESKELLVFFDKKIKICQYSPHKEFKKISKWKKPKQRLRFLKLMAQKNYLVTCGDCIIQIWDVSRPEKLILPIPIRTLFMSNIYHLQLFPRSKSFYGQGNNLKVFNIQTGKLIGSYLNRNKLSIGNTYAKVTSDQRKIMMASNLEWDQGYQVIEINQRKKNKIQEIPSK